MGLFLILIISTSCAEVALQTWFGDHENTFTIQYGDYAKMTAERSNFARNVRLYIEVDCGGDFGYNLEVNDEAYSNTFMAQDFLQNGEMVIDVQVTQYVTTFNVHLTPLQSQCVFSSFKIFTVDTILSADFWAKDLKIGEVSIIEIYPSEAEMTNWYAIIDTFEYKSLQIRNSPEIHIHTGYPVGLENLKKQFLAGKGGFCLTKNVEENVWLPIIVVPMEDTFVQFNNYGATDPVEVEWTTLDDEYSGLNKYVWTIDELIDMDGIRIKYTITDGSNPLFQQTDGFKYNPHTLSTEMVNFFDPNYIVELLSLAVNDDSRIWHSFIVPEMYKYLTDEVCLERCSISSLDSVTEYIYEVVNPLEFIIRIPNSIFEKFVDYKRDICLDTGETVGYVNVDSIYNIGVEGVFNGRFFSSNLSNNGYGAADYISFGVEYDCSEYFVISNNSAKAKFGLWGYLVLIILGVLYLK